MGERPEPRDPRWRGVYPGRSQNLCSNCGRWAYCWVLDQAERIGHELEGVFCDDCVQEMVGMAQRLKGIETTPPVPSVVKLTSPPEGEKRRPRWEQCPERQPGLSHAHWDRCKPDDVHPNSSKKHSIDQCCHCEKLLQ